MKNSNWDSYQLFLQVARTGGLTGASTATALSPATIGRRMLDLEQELGRTLFHRSQTGYRLTADGQTLSIICRRWRRPPARSKHGGNRPKVAATVRIAAGTWISWLLTENFSAIRMPGDTFGISLDDRRGPGEPRITGKAISAFAPSNRRRAISRPVCSAKSPMPSTSDAMPARTTPDGSPSAQRMRSRPICAGPIRMPHPPSSPPSTARAPCRIWCVRARERRYCPVSSAISIPSCERLRRRAAGAAPPPVDRHECRGPPPPGNPHGRRPDDEAFEKLYRPLRRQARQPRIIWLYGISRRTSPTWLFTPSFE